MKLFAPKNVSWDVRDPNSGWSYLGTSVTPSGVRVSETSALTLPAIVAATRIISETLASLPLNTLQQVDARTQNKAMGHPLWTILHDVPNPEQDIMCFLDMQTAFQVNWGNAYAEKQRDGGEIVALWPIHPSRIPLSNITRNPTEPQNWRKIVAGQPGEIVYWVKNDDGTVTPIPADDMLHVPGVLSTNGITGQSIIRLIASAIGIAVATEEHVGSFFSKGAMAQVALLSDKVVGKEAAERLRRSWQETYGGSKNAYKAVLLEEGMKLQAINISPEDSQLIAQRQFNVTEIARGYRLPPHLLGDLSRSSFSNIEAENLSFVIHSMQPWITRWEKALKRQLLTREERGRFQFKFNMNGLLRGDHAARAQFYQALFNLGTLSSNDIRGLEDMNPIEGGDQYFVPANNLMPIDKVAEMADAQIKKLTAPAPAPATTDKAVRFAAARRFVEFLNTRLDHLESQIATKADFAPLAEKITEIPLKIAENLPKPPEIDTSEAEKLAIRESKLAEEQAAIDAQRTRERETTDSVLSLALKRAIDNLAVWESKALDKATEKPLEWKEWRERFYHRFCKHFEADLGEFSADCERCGVILDLSWAANRYAKQSIDDLRTLDQHASDNWHDRLRECVDHFRKRQWTDRSGTLAGEMIERGKRLFSERKAEKCVN